MYKKDYLDLKKIKSNILPWFWTNKLDSRNIYENNATTSSWTPVIWSLSISSLWNVNVSLWFKPSLVTFTSICSSGWWTWAATELSQFWMDNRSFTIIDTQCVYMRNTWWTAVHRTEFTSMDATWFTLNCILATETATVRYIAYR